MAVLIYDNRKDWNTCKLMRNSDVVEQICINTNNISTVDIQQFVLTIICKNSTSVTIRFTNRESAEKEFDKLCSILATEKD